MTAPQVHDLIRIDPAIAQRWDAPEWVLVALAAAPWVVVRRARTVTGIPVGVRGPTRTHRFAATIEASDECERLEPARTTPRIAGRTDRLAGPALAVDDVAATLGIRWGVTGAYGFELASGVVATHARSDLDIVVYAGPPRATLGEFATWCSQIERATGVRIDADVVFTGTGAGVALGELVSGAAFVLAKTRTGPQLIAAPR